MSVAKATLCTEEWQGVAEHSVKSSPRKKPEKAFSGNGMLGGESPFSLPEAPYSAVLHVLVQKIAETK